LHTPQVLIDRVVSVPFEENCYLARLPNRNDCLVIDPGLEPEKILARMSSLGVVPGAILNTHGHADHIAGNAALKDRWPECPIVIGVADAPKLTDAALNLSAAFDFGLTSPPADVTVSQGDTYSAAGFDLQVLGVPGHSAGHVVFLWKHHQPPIAFVGDVIFAGSVGRTDFPDGNTAELLSGIRQKILVLPDETLLLSGHGPPTTVAQERRGNPFFQGDGPLD